MASRESPSRFTPIVSRFTPFDCTFETNIAPLDILVISYRLRYIVISNSPTVDRPKVADGNLARSGE